VHRWISFIHGSLRPRKGIFYRTGP